MGYRHYIAVIDKTLYQQIKNLTKKELSLFFKDQADSRGYVYRKEFIDEVHELGKYVDAEYLKEHSSRFFENKETNEIYHGVDTELYVINKKGLEAIIEKYHQDIHEYFKKLADNYKNGKKDVFGEDTIEKFLSGKVITWENSRYYKPYSLEGEILTHSWEYEHAIFEIIRIYKSIDWENQIVCITAH